jgi:alcohol dehydrogenase
VSAGLAHPEAKVSFPAVSLVAEERTFRGSYMGSCVPQRDVPRFIDLYRQGRLPIDRLLSERIGLEDLNAGFDRLADGHTVRQVVVM